MKDEDLKEDISEHGAEAAGKHSKAELTLLKTEISSSLIRLSN